MKLEIKLHEESETGSHQLEFPPATTSARAASGRFQFLLDQQTGELDWAEITPGVYSILVGGRSYEARVTPDSLTSAARAGIYLVTLGPQTFRVEIRDPRTRRHTSPPADPKGPQEIVAPMPGKIVKILVSEDQEVGPGKGLLVIEAMKMQNELRAPRSGRVEKIYVAEGMGVETGFKLLRLV